jgi:hypothetical protein
MLVQKLRMEARAVTVAYVESQRVCLEALACGMLAVGSSVRRRRPDLRRAPAPCTDD